MTSYKSTFYLSLFFVWLLLNFYSAITEAEGFLGNKTKAESYVRNSVENSEILKHMRTMTDEQKAAQMLLVYYTHTEFSLQHEFGGVLLMQPAIKNIEELRKDLQKLKTESVITPWIAIDHEGGLVNRLKKLPGWKNTLSAREMSLLTLSGVEAQADKAALYLSGMGINLNLAPVLDPATNQKAQLTWMGQNKRSFGSTSEQIVPKATTLIKVYKCHGIQSIVKHFPGYTATQDSDIQQLTVKTSQKKLAELQTIFQAVAQQAAGTMMSNITYASISNKPAVLTSEINQQAKKIFSHGMLITDDLWATGIRRWGRSEKLNKKTATGNTTDIDKDTELLNVTKAAILAGNDMLMITYPSKAVLMKNQMAQWMKTDPGINKAVNLAVERLLKLKHKSFKEKLVKSN